MSTQPLEQAIAVARGVLAGVGPDQLHDATPCASWDVSALINHIVGGQNFFCDGIEGRAPETNQPDFAAGDYVAEFDAASARCLAGFQADGAMDQTLDLPFGKFPAQGFLGLATTDTFQHAWDLAKATGQSTDLAPGLAAGLLEQAQKSIPDAFRGPEGAPFGPLHEAPAESSSADQLAAFLGREI